MCFIPSLTKIRMKTHLCTLTMVLTTLTSLSCDCKTYPVESYANKTTSKIRSKFLDNVRGQFMTFLISVSSLMLFESLFWRLTGHTYIKAFKYTIKLWVGGSKFSVFAKYPLR